MQVDRGRKEGALKLLKTFLNMFPYLSNFNFCYGCLKVEHLKESFSYNIYFFLTS
jgi:hypothetical protein